MSRETDSPSAGSGGAGDAAYPSGTPPYGTPTAPDAGTDEVRPATRAEQRRTETTMTTRIRINIPGSRPIPPVVMRKTVEGGGESPADPEATTAAPAPDAPPAPAASPPPTPRPAASGGPATAEPPGSAGEKPTSDWFAPRRPGPVVPPGAGGTVGPPAPGRGTGGPGATSGPGQTRGGDLPSATGGPVAPGHGGGTGSFDLTGALGSAPRADRAMTHGTDPASQAGDPTRPADGRSHPRPGPTGGPVTPDPAPGGLTAAGPFAAGGPPAHASVGQGVTGVPSGVPRTPDHESLGEPDFGVTGPADARSVEDTAALTPQLHTPDPAAAFPTPSPDRSAAPFVPGGPGDGRGRQTARPADPLPPADEPSAPAKAKGRNKLALLGLGVLLVVGGAYGGGLLMNHSDVPKGTTVLGVDIGGGTHDDAVRKLESALGERAALPLGLTVDGATVDLRPDQAGLRLDTQATVATAARSDYHPVSVIGSLLGRERAVEPVLPVDREKLYAALERTAGESGSVTEGSIRFESGRAVAVYPEAGEGVDVEAAADAVVRAYRVRLESGGSTPVPVPTTTREPTVTKAEVDRMMREFAEPAMSANVVVRTDEAAAVPMSPQNSLWKFLGVEAVDGKLVDKPDLDALAELYGGAFDGVLVTRGNGERTPVTPQDVYAALRPALTSPTDRVGVIDTDPS
ncbi:hypothetical protein [Streptomyces sp. HSG2]|uniref:hypothetical protein n=1 Tax=Streptomyces sp. HSG2 TaxID=2797167 RepID=UPI0019076B0A|nr:hypothetical protein [Streptomyces sp. HSG2]